LADVDYKHSDDLNEKRWLENLDYLKIFTKENVVLFINSVLN